jgi:hypothetical protein
MRETWNLTGTRVRRTSMTGHHPPGVRALLAAAALLVTATLSACGPSGPDPGSTPSMTTGPSVTSSPGDVRGRLASALQGTSPAYAKLVENPQTSLIPVTADWLPGWQILDVVNKTPPHPQRFFVALSDQGRADVLTGRPEAFSAVLIDAGVRIDSADRAADVAATFLDTTRDFKVFAYRVDSVDDISWLPRPSAAEDARRDALAQDYDSLVKPPQVAESGDGWQVTVWMVQGRDLVTHEVGLASGTAVTDATETVEKDIPVPYSA